MDKTKILIVDDIPENITALSNLIMAEDLEILSAKNADDALALLLNNDFALALLDVHLPNISGFELARLIRGVNRYRNLPVIFVTAHQRDQNVIFEGYETGAVDLLFKPLDPHVVRSKVRVFVQIDQQSKKLKSQMEQVEKLKLEAENANAAKSRFLANMSHEIRTPLGAVLGFADVLAQGNATKEERQECISAIRRNGQLLLRLINDILDLSKIEAERLELENIRFDIKDLLRDIDSSLSLRAVEKGIYLKTEIPDSISGYFYSDPIRIKQILLNVIGNAIKFTFSGGITAKVSAEKLPHDPQRYQFSILVEDTGVGLHEDQIKKLFKPFSQADSSTRRKFGGTGLGLIISKQIANSMGGDISLISSTPGKGSKFLVTFQVTKEVEDAVSAKKAPSDDLQIQENILRGKKILVVDDAKDNRVLIEMYLKKLKVYLFQAASGQEALDRLKENEPDLILMDIQMPEMDGYETTRRIRAQGFDKPILALTAHALVEEREKCHRAGCDQVLTKPIKRKELINALSEALRDDSNQSAYEFDEKDKPQHP